LYIGDFDVRDDESGVKMKLYNGEVVWKPITELPYYPRCLMKPRSKIIMYLSNDRLKDLHEREYVYRAGSRLCTRHYWGEPERAPH